MHVSNDDFEISYTIQVQFLWFYIYKIALVPNFVVTHKYKTMNVSSFVVTCHIYKMNTSHTMYLNNACYQFCGNASHILNDTCFLFYRDMSHICCLQQYYSYGVGDPSQLFNSKRWIFIVLSSFCHQQVCRDKISSIVVKSHISNGKLCFDQSGIASPLPPLNSNSPFDYRFIISSLDPSCPEAWLHACDDGQCIISLYVCDNVTDCDDGSDERECPPCK